MPSFDIVSEIDIQEVDNAINQARKEIEARYDFKGSKAEVLWDKKEVTLTAEDDYKVGAMASILQTKLHRRGIDIKAIKFEKIEEAGGRMLRQKVTLVQGIDREVAKDIIKLIKDSKLKVQPQVADDKLKVSSKSIDELQECISLVRGGNFPVPLQFNNMRA
ncbi:YajQ family cyclic di-GMP-binding protein [Bdellovibrio bacteriovorus]|uniref:YajQ family cyclic di-GMP-binding protein n=1 Tax=Bdellovibrio bacteriovorus TaxID=959 RepID=UPI0021D01A6E|nr:YajQ family cyclic di-GMP-binding protein [Bdellovibrio bacteriovorus]UXR65431.1 YajQ family cyclic di-GMP-binding protein [Bdellovibrio bacteriovorus]